MKKTASILPFVLVMFHCCAAATCAQTPSVLEGRWEGVMVREGAELPVILEFTQSGGSMQGFWSAPAMRVAGVPLTNIRVDLPRVHFELAGDATTTVFDGELRADALAGTFKEGSAAATFSLQRAKLLPPAYHEEEVRFQNGAVALSGTLLSPNRSGPHPAVVFLHGSGPEGRFASRFLAARFAQQGIAALIYDKRGVGTSSGDWKRSTFEDLADDALAGIRLLRQRKEIAPQKIGIYGHSQGGFISPLVVSRAKPGEVAFVIAAASFGGPAYYQDLYRVGNRLRERFPADQAGPAMTYYTQFIEVARTGQGWGQFDAATEKVRGEPWFSFLALPPKDHWLWAYYRGTGNYDSLPYWQKVAVPVLLVYGERDRLIPVQESAAAIERQLRKANNRDYTMVILPRADHPLRIQPDPSQPFEWPLGAPGFPELLAAWVKYRFGAAEK